MMYNAFSPNVELLTSHWDRMIPFGLELLENLRQAAQKLLGPDFIRKNEGELHTCGAACGAILGEKFVCNYPHHHGLMDLNMSYCSATWQNLSGLSHHL